MTNQEILEKAIQKADSNGWEYPFGANCYEINKYVKARPEVIAFGFREEWQDDNTPGHLEGHWSIPELIFDHDFAKALWGEELIQYPEGDKYTITAKLNPAPNFCRSSELFVWEYHLQQMVKADDPVKYLGENLPKSVEDDYTRSGAARYGKVEPIND